MSTAVRIEYRNQPEPEQIMDNVIQFPGAHMAPQKKSQRTNSPLKSNGQPKATAAEPIRDMADVHKMQEYFRSKNQTRNYLMLTLGISFALRAGDLLSLEIQDVFNQDGTARPYVTIYEDKTDKRNRIKINDTCKIALEEYFAALPEPVFSDDPLFPSREKDEYGDKKPITLRQFNNILKKAAKECGVTDHVSTHSMRKTYAYQAMKTNGETQDTLYALQYTFNHSDIRTTMRYTGMEQDKADRLRDQIGDMLSL